MRVLQIGMTANHGGVESFVLNYGKILKKDGIVFDYVDLYGKGLVDEERLLSEGSRIYTLQDYRKHPVSTIKQIAKIVKSGSYGCVHINMLSAASLMTVFGALLGGARVLVHSHNTQALGLHRRVLHGMNALLLSRLPVERLACGKQAGSWMFGRKPYEVVPNAIDTGKYRFREESRKELRAQLPVEEDTLILGFVGRLCPQKNSLYLPKILDAVRKSGLQNVKLLIVGDGELREQMLQAASELGVEEHILCVGSQKNVNQWYSAMDALLLPSLWEGLPLVGVEAQAAGLPCFLSDRITDETVLTDLVRFCDLTETAENWAESIRSIREHPVSRSEYADRIARTAYSIDRSAERLREIYRAVSEKEVSAE